MIGPNNSNPRICFLLIAAALCHISTVSADEPVAAQPVGDEAAVAAAVVEAPVAPAPEAAAPTTIAPMAPEAVPETAPAVSVAPISEAAQGLAPTAIILMNADGVTYYRWPLDAKTEEKLTQWLVECWQAAYLHIDCHAKFCRVRSI